MATYLFEGSLLETEFGGVSFNYNIPNNELPNVDNIGNAISKTDIRKKESLIRSMSKCLPKDAPEVNEPEKFYFLDEEKVSCRLRQNPPTIKMTYELYSKARQFVLPYSTNDPESDTCAICMSAFEPTDITKRLHCLHHFHVDCIRTWLMEKSDCPICRVAVADDPRFVILQSCMLPIYRHQFSEFPAYYHPTFYSIEPSNDKHHINPCVDIRKSIITMQIISSQKDLQKLEEQRENRKTREKLEYEKTREMFRMREMMMGVGGPIRRNAPMFGFNPLLRMTYEEYRGGMVYYHHPGTIHNKHSTIISWFLGSIQLYINGFELGLRDGWT